MLFIQCALTVSTKFFSVLCCVRSRCIYQAAWVRVCVELFSTSLFSWHSFCWHKSLNQCFTDKNWCGPNDNAPSRISRCNPNRRVIVLNLLLHFVHSCWNEFYPLIRRVVAICNQIEVEILWTGFDCKGNAFSRLWKICVRFHVLFAFWIRWSCVDNYTTIVVSAFSKYSKSICFPSSHLAFCFFLARFSQ